MVSDIVIFFCHTIDIFISICHYSHMEAIASAEAAKILGINKRTLYRWEKEGKIRSTREGVLSFRVFNKSYIEIVKRILDLNKQEKEHLKKLPRIIEEIEKYHLLQEYVPGEPLKMSSEKDVELAMAAFDAEEKWVADHKRLLNELLSYPHYIIKELLAN